MTEFKDNSVDEALSDREYYVHCCVSAIRRAPIHVQKSERKEREQVLRSTSYDEENVQGGDRIDMVSLCTLTVDCLCYRLAAKLWRNSEISADNSSMYLWHTPCRVMLIQITKYKSFDLIKSVQGTAESRNQGRVWTVFAVEACCAVKSSPLIVLLSSNADKKTLDGLLSRG